jgi:hypothetical protein
MTEDRPHVPHNDDAGSVTGGSVDAAESAEEAMNGPSRATAAPRPDSGHVPEKQIGRWKDDGGAVDRSG